MSHRHRITIRERERDMIEIAIERPILDQATGVNVRRASACASWDNGTRQFTIEFVPDNTKGAVAVLYKRPGGHIRLSKRMIAGFPHDAVLPFEDSEPTVKGRRLITAPVPRKGTAGASVKPPSVITQTISGPVVQTARAWIHGKHEAHHLRLGLTFNGPAVKECIARGRVTATGDAIAGITIVPISPAATGADNSSACVRGTIPGSATVVLDEASIYRLRLKPIAYDPIEVILAGNEDFVHVSGIPRRLVDEGDRPDAESLKEGVQVAPAPPPPEPVVVSVAPIPPPPKVEVKTVPLPKPPVKKPAPPPPPVAEEEEPEDMPVIQQLESATVAKPSQFADMIAEAVEADQKAGMLLLKDYITATIAELRDRKINLAISAPLGAMDSEPVVKITARRVTIVEDSV